MVREMLTRSCCTTPAAMGFWTAAFVLLYGAGLVLGSIWPGVHAYTNTLILVALGFACALNFGRHRTLHCALTGPLFLLGAVVMALIEADVWAVDIAAVWGIVLLGVGIAFVIEWRTVGQDRNSNNCCTPAVSDEERIP